MIPILWLDSNFLSKEGEINRWGWGQFERGSAIRKEHLFKTFRPENYVKIIFSKMILSKKWEIFGCQHQHTESTYKKS